MATNILNETLNVYTKTEIVFVFIKMYFNKLYLQPFLQCTLDCGTHIGCWKTHIGHHHSPNNLPEVTVFNLSLKTTATYNHQRH